MGGEVLYAGKPSADHDLALAKAEAAGGRKVPLNRVLAIGNSMRTDLRGAHATGVEPVRDLGVSTPRSWAARAAGQRHDESGKFAAGEMPKAVMRHLTW